MNAMEFAQLVLVSAPILNGIFIIVLYKFGFWKRTSIEEIEEYYKEREKH